MLVSCDPGTPPRLLPRLFRLVGSGRQSGAIIKMGYMTDKVSVLSAPNPSLTQRFFSFLRPASDNLKSTRPAPPHRLGSTRSAFIDEKGLEGGMEMRPKESRAGLSGGAVVDVDGYQMGYGSGVGPQSENRIQTLGQNQSQSERRDVRLQRRISID